MGEDAAREDGGRRFLWYLLVIVSVVLLAYVLGYIYVRATHPGRTMTNAAGWELRQVAEAKYGDLSDPANFQRYVDNEDADPDLVKITNNPASWHQATVVRDPWYSLFWPAGKLEELLGGRRYELVFVFGPL